MQPPGQCTAHMHQTTLARKENTRMGANRHGEKNSALPKEGTYQFDPAPQRLHSSHTSVGFGAFT